MLNKVTSTMVDGKGEQVACFEKQSSLFLCKFFSTCAVLDVREPPLSSDNMSNCPLQVNLNELDQQMEQIKEMFVKKQEMMKKMSSATAPDPAQLAA